MVKKTKSLPKSKPKVPAQEESKKQSSQPPIQHKCAVCKEALKPEAKTTLYCAECKKHAHSHCYSPSNTNKKFNCDVCSNNKRKISCAFCHKYEKTQMLKFLGENTYAHVDCALMSSENKVVSFSELKIVHKKGGEKEVGECEFCKKQEVNLLKCLFCNFTAHYRCLVERLLNGEEYYLILKWLDKCEKQNFLLNYICKKQNSPLQQFLSLPPQKKPRELFICPKHTWEKKEFSWCPCDHPERNNEEEFPSVYCDRCNRCVHHQCTGIHGKQQVSKIQFVCEGCKTGDVFKKEIKFSELISEIMKIESEEKLTENHFRILNSFPFGYSEVLEAKIVQEIKDIEFYFVEKELKELKQKKVSLPEKIEGSKFFKLAMYLLFQETQEDYKKKFQGSQNINNVIRLLNENTILSKYPNLLEKIQDYFNEFVDGIKLNEICESLLQKLGDFIEECKKKYDERSSMSQISVIAKIIKEISSELFEITRIQVKSKPKGKLLNLSQSSVFKILVKNNLSIPMIEKVLTNYQIIKKCIEDDYCMNENDYNLILEGNYGNETSEEKIVTTTIHNFFKETLSKVKLKYKAIEKENLWRNACQHIKPKLHQKVDAKKIENDLIRNKVVFCGGHEEKDQNMLNNMGTGIIEFNIFKKKFLLLASEGEKSITDQHANLYPKLYEFQKQNAHLLKPSELKALHKLSIKISFYIEIIRKGTPLLKDLECQNVDSDDMDGRMISQDQESTKGNDITKKLFKIFEIWEGTIISCETFLSNLAVLAVEKIEFKTNSEKRKLKDFVISVLEYVKEEEENGTKIKGKDIKNIKNILEYFGLEEKFYEFEEKFQAYSKWIKTINKKASDIPLILEKLQGTQLLLKSIESLMNSAHQLQLNVSEEMNKLGVLRQWCRLSEKVLSCKRKPSINAIQNLRILADKIRYPNNEVKKNINNLQGEGKALNKQISRFLDKPKLPEYMDIQDELKLIQGKISFDEALEMKKKFEEANLDITAEIQELESELKDFEELPKTFSEIIKKGNLKDLSTLRQKLLNVSIRHQRLHEYEHLLKKICEIKCLNFTHPITRKEYFQLLSFGGEAALFLIEKTQNLHRAYKLIEKAENEVLTNPMRKRNFSNLIPLEERRIKEIKDDLRYDPIQLSNFEKARVHVMRLKDSFQKYKREMAEIDKFTQIQDDLLGTIFNTKQILGQISANKRQHNDLLRKVLEAIQYGDNYMDSGDEYENIFQTDKSGHNHYVDRYHSLGIKNSILEMFQKDFTNYIEFDKLYKEKDMGNYRKFAYTCSRFTQWAARIPEIIQRRQNFLQAVYQFLQRTEEPEISLCKGVIQEGCALHALTNKKKLYLDCLFKMNERIKQYGSSDDEEDDELSDQEDDISDQNESGFDDQESEDEEENMGGKRGRDNQIILDDD